MGFNSCRVSEWVAAGLNQVIHSLNRIRSVALPYSAQIISIARMINDGGFAETV